MATIPDLEALGYLVAESSPATDERGAIYLVTAEGVALYVAAEDLAGLELPPVASPLELAAPMAVERAAPAPPPFEELVAGLDPGTATVADIIAAAANRA